jgi:hypothetical protein
MGGGGGGEAVTKVGWAMPPPSLSYSTAVYNMRVCVCESEIFLYGHLCCVLIARFLNLFLGRLKTVSYAPYVLIARFLWEGSRWLVLGEERRTPPLVSMFLFGCRCVNPKINPCGDHLEYSCTQKLNSAPPPPGCT